MNFKEGDLIRYNFPEPLISGKEFITGKIFFVGTNKVSVRCDDNSIMNITFRNFDRIELLTAEAVYQ